MLVVGWKKTGAYREKWRPDHLASILQHELPTGLNAKQLVLKQKQQVDKEH